MATKVLWIGERDESVLDLLRQQVPPGIDLLLPESGVPSKSDLAESDVILNGSGGVSGALMRSAPRLQHVQRLGAGLDGVDVDVARQLGISVANLPAQNSIAVAEHTILLTLACARQLCSLHNNMVAGRWLPNEQLSETFELYGKTFGIIGFGSIGREVARRARGLGMTVRYYDVVRAPTEMEDELAAEFTPLEELFGLVDVMSVHVPLTPTTAMIIGEDQLGAMRPGSILVSISRSGVVDENALIHRLASGHIAAAGVDVWRTEPASLDDPLLTAPNVVATPHAGAQTRDTVTRVFRAAFTAIQHVLPDQPQSAVDPRENPFEPVRQTEEGELTDPRHRMGRKPS